MTTLAEFDAAQAAARAEFLKTANFAALLPTAGVSIAWIGENGYEADGNTRKPPIQKTMEVAPKAIHRTLLYGSRMIQYGIPNSYGTGMDEPTHDYAYRREFARKYLTAIVDA